jgi:Rps23 Pro-64 3,4-dihydroxylase Tpa1-like proline 4-hydroxylase
MLPIHTILSSSTTSNFAEWKNSFERAKPFKHLCIDNFLNPEIADALFEEFPKFEKQYALNEHGKVGGKAVRTDLGALGAAYKELETFIHSKEFLDYMSNMLGIPGLLSDPTMYGGGTHENLHGQELDPHVDFNYNYERSLHRRVNLLIYLNRDWSPDWGGAIELHSNPRDQESNSVIHFDCVFNRCVIFETNEHSWHGFRRINLPPDKRHLSRKCISIYLYSKERPEEEIAPQHGTFYVQRPLPERIAANYTLSADDVSEIKTLMQRRDDWIAFYHKLELRKQSEIELLSKNLRAEIEKLSLMVKQQNDEVELRGAILDRKRRELSEERQIASKLRESLAENERKLNGGEPKISTNAVTQ